MDMLVETVDTRSTFDALILSTIFWQASIAALKSPNYESPNVSFHCTSQFSFVEVLREGDSKDTRDAAEPCHPGGFYA